MESSTRKFLTWNFWQIYIYFRWISNVKIICLNFTEVWYKWVYRRLRDDKPWINSNPWWRHQMDIISAILALCEGYPPVTGGFPSQRPVTRSFDVFFELRLKKKRLTKQSRRRWFETPTHSSWRHYNVSVQIHVCATRPQWGYFTDMQVTNFNHQAKWVYINGLMQDCSNSSALAMELLQPCTKPSICAHYLAIKCEL